MRVALSYDAFRLAGRGGVNRYGFELYRGLTAAGVDTSIIAPLHIDVGLLSAAPHIGRYIGSFRPRKARQAATAIGGRIAESRWLAKADKNSIYHKTWYGPMASSTGKAKVAVTVYDMIHERYPGDFPARDAASRRKREWCSAADIIIAISQTTADDLVEMWGIERSRIRVIYLGASETASQPLPSLPHPYVLYVGSRTRGYKNFDLIVRALSEYPPLADLSLVAFGDPFSRAEERFLDSYRVRSRAVAISGTDEQLAAAYDGAAMLACPSLYEGFGLPPLEAMQRGCVVAFADRGALPEIVGDAGAAFDPHSVESLREKLSMLLYDDALSQRLRVLGHERAKQFSWSRMVNQTLDAYRSLMREAD